MNVLRNTRAASSPRYLLTFPYFLAAPSVVLRTYILDHGVWAFTGRIKIGKRSVSRFYGSMTLSPFTIDSTAGLIFAPLICSFGGRDSMEQN